MSTVKCQFSLVATGDGKTTFIVLRRIRFTGTETWYVFPEELQSLAHHKHLLELSPIKAAMRSMKTRGSLRNVNVSLSAELAELYVDADGNFIFGDFLLGEASTSSSSAAGVSTADLSDLSSCLSRLADKEESVKSILNHFIIEKFSSRNKNVAAWCSSFEKESDRFKLSGSKKIEVFKSCLDPSLSDWFSIAQNRLGLDTEWELWRDDLIATFGDLSWKPIRYAYSFKYLPGSYLDYSIKKEKMLLELDRELSDIFILDLIIIGLPTHIQNSLNRNQVTSVALLHNKLKKFEADDKIFENSSFRNNKNRDAKNNSGSFRSSASRNFENKSYSNVNSGQKSSNPVSKTACSVCAKRGFPDQCVPAMIFEAFCQKRDIKKVVPQDFHVAKWKESVGMGLLFYVRSYYSKPTIIQKSEDIGFCNVAYEMQQVAYRAGRMSKTEITTDMRFKSTIFGSDKKMSITSIALSLLMDTASILKMNIRSINFTSTGGITSLTFPNKIEIRQMQQILCAFTHLKNKWGANASGTSNTNNIYPTLVLETDPPINGLRGTELYPRIVTFLEALYTKAVMCREFSQAVGLINITHDVNGYKRSESENEAREFIMEGTLKVMGTGSGVLFHDFRDVCGNRTLIYGTSGKSYKFSGEGPFMLLLSPRVITLMFRYAAVVIGEMYEVDNGMNVAMSAQIRYSDMCGVIREKDVKITAAKTDQDVLSSTICYDVTDVEIENLSWEEQVAKFEQSKEEVARIALGKIILTQKELSDYSGYNAYAHLNVNKAISKMHRFDSKKGDKAPVAWRRNK